MFHMFSSSLALPIHIEIPSIAVEHHIIEPVRHRIPTRLPSDRPGSSRIACQVTLVLQSAEFSGLPLYTSLLYIVRNLHDSTYRFTAPLDKNRLGMFSRRILDRLSCQVLKISTND